MYKFESRNVFVTDLRARWVQDNFAPWEGVNDRGAIFNCFRMSFISLLKLLRDCKRNTRLYRANENFRALSIAMNFAE